MSSFSLFTDREERKKYEKILAEYEQKEKLKMENGERESQEIEYSKEEILQLIQSTTTCTQKILSKREKLDEADLKRYRRAKVETDLLKKAN